MQVQLPHCTQGPHSPPNQQWLYTFCAPLTTVAVLLAGRRWVSGPCTTMVVFVELKQICSPDRASRMLLQGSFSPPVQQARLREPPSRTWITLLSAAVSAWRRWRRPLVSRMIKRMRSNPSTFITSRRGSPH